MQTRQTPTAWEDVLRMPDDGNRYEFIGGRLYVTPAPVTRHQRVVMRLCSALPRILVDSGRGEAFCAPLLVEFPGTGDRVQPDLLFISRERRAIIGEKQVTGAPDLVVEILSPSTAHRDRGIKLDLYARHGVRQYWIADPVDDVVDVWRFADERGHERFSGELPVRIGRERLAARGQSPPGISMKQARSAPRVSVPRGGRTWPWEIRTATHPRWPLRFTRSRCKVYITLCNVCYTFATPKAALRVAPRANSAAIPPSSRLAGPAPRRSRCSRGFTSPAPPPKVGRWRHPYRYFPGGAGMR